MKENGFSQITEELMKKAISERKKYYVFVNGYTFLGSETIIKREKPMILKDWGEKGFFWMSPNAKRTGYRASVGQYVKEA